ncbi:hypothetical protein CLV91_3236 [Maribacter vaceletii]|uniref:Uncharacterized protein n=1 Tax=Maribacter vaceletii TaxID=1206816 RepID=A0A495DS90_9FLAO|nr:hypothetical protein [Maribacter vaceletii]RKR07006.1 hypothetical protein CLV91_3236 [Maribacter vaceletii]
MKKQIVFLVLVFIAIVGCTDRDDNVSKVNLRIKNTSTVNFDEVTVVSSENVYSNIAVDAYSDYLEFDELYSYAYVQILADGETYTLQPIDFVGETPLAVGFYTYELGIDQTGNVVLVLKTD